jgi:diguanylate cyclase (GGDEF)-like protein
MHVAESLNFLLGSLLIVILIYADYLRKYNTDTFQRSVFLHILVFAFIPMICDLLYFLIHGLPGRLIYVLFYIVVDVYYSFQLLSFLYIGVFIDYTVFKDPGRTKKIIRVVWVIAALHVLALAVNLFYPFHFYVVEPENILVHGNFYILHIFISYSPLLFILYDIIFSSKDFKKSQYLLTLIFLLLNGVGSLVDAITGTTTLIWPCFTAALLYAYFFIIRTDSKIDSLTGIGNRYAFNEFINKLASQSVKESYSVVIIDMDHFKEINDTLGHAEGDNALRDMAAIIKGCIRHSDFAARYGGDEFVLATKAEHDIEKLIGRIERAMGIQNEKHIRPYRLEMSYGYDVYTVGQSRSINEFLNHVDGLMYQHKAERRLREKDGQKP